MGEVAASCQLGSPLVVIFFLSFGAPRFRIAQMRCPCTHLIAVAVIPLIARFGSGFAMAVGLACAVGGLSTVFASLARADEGLDGSVAAEEVCDPTAPVAATPQAPAHAKPLATTDDLYSLTPLARDTPGYAAVFEAWRQRKWELLSRLSADLVENANRIQAKQAAQLLMALGLEAQKRWSDADRAWQALAQEGPLAQRARRHLAELALRRADEQEALAQWAAIAPWHVGRDEALLKMAALELKRNAIGPARDALERIDSTRLAMDRKATLGLLAGQLAQRGGRSDEAKRLFLGAWLLDAGTQSEAAAAQLLALDAAPSAADRIERILRRTEVKRGQLQAWLSEADSATDDGSGLRLYARGVLGTRDKKARQAAVALLRKAIEKLDDPLLKARATYALGDALGKTGDDKLAIAQLDTITTLLSGHSGPAVAELQARTLARLHRLYSNVDSPQLAAQALKRLLDNHPDAAGRELALWALGWQLFVGGDHTKALELFIKLEREHGNQWTGARQPWRAKAMYWQARCLQLMGQLEPALEVWASVANTWPQTYYGILALDRIGAIDGERALRLQGPPPSHAADVPPPSLDRLRVGRQQALDEAVLLVQMGLHSEARSLLREQLNRGLPRDGVHLLAVLYELQGNRPMAYGVMERHTRRAARPDDSTAQMWRQSFPRAFFEDADAAAQGAGVARSLLYAVMRHESSFVPTTVSKAGAYGLVQLLSPVAKNIADLHDTPYAGAASLLRPKVNLTLGAQYLSQMLSFYKGNLQLVAAAYNAGPYAVRDWVSKHPQLPTDIFVENIPYPATRAYVMQVTASAQTYAWLYPEWAEMRRDGLSRAPQLPRGFGPFMQKNGAVPVHTALACRPPPLTQ